MKKVWCKRMVLVVMVLHVSLSFAGEEPERSPESGPQSLALAREDFAQRVGADLWAEMNDWDERGGRYGAHRGWPSAPRSRRDYDAASYERVSAYSDEDGYDWDQRDSARFGSYSRLRVRLARSRCADAAGTGAAPAVEDTVLEYGDHGQEKDDAGSESDSRDVGYDQKQEQENEQDNRAGDNGNNFWAPWVWKEEDGGISI
jgi:hypothetical protein